MSLTTEHHVVTEPASGQVIDLPAGARLELKFRRGGLGRSAWHVEDRPAYLVPLEESGHGFHFLAFRCGEGEAGVLRLVRRRAERPELTETRHLTVVVSP